MLYNGTIAKAKDIESEVNNVSMEEIKRTSMALYDKESDYEEIAKITDESVMAVYEQYRADDGHDIRGNISVNVKDGEVFRHIATYAIHGAKTAFYSTVDVYYPKGLTVCDIQITVSVQDNKNPENDTIADEVSGRIAKAIGKRMPDSSLEDHANYCTLEKVFRNETLAFDKEWAYEEAEAYGIKDYGLVDKVLSDLLKEEVLEIV